MGQSQPQSAWAAETMEHGQQCSAVPTLDKLGDFLYCYTDCGKPCTDYGRTAAASTDGSEYYLLETPHLTVACPGSKVFTLLLLLLL